ncbi:MAG: GHKL domain-containing protein [Ruminococcus sp.]|nr:GHKL domain-containing protein [Ruminococcus sp.]
MICKNEGIDIKCYVQKNLPEFDDMIFSTIFGNLIDNAIESERRENIKEIRLAIESIGTYLHITIQNRIHEPILVNGRLPKTQKKDKINHGIGMHSITETLSQIDGVIEIYERDTWFVADVILPIADN